MPPRREATSSASLQQVDDAYHQVQDVKDAWPAQTLDPPPHNSSERQRSGIWWSTGIHHKLVVGMPSGDPSYLNPTPLTPVRTKYGSFRRIPSKSPMNPGDDPADRLDPDPDLDPMSWIRSITGWQRAALSPSSWRRRCIRRRPGEVRMSVGIRGEHFVERST